MHVQNKCMCVACTEVLARYICPIMHALKDKHGSQQNARLINAVHIFDVVFELSRAKKWVSLREWRVKHSPGSRTWCVKSNS